MRPNRPSATISVDMRPGAGGGSVPESKKSLREENFTEDHVGGSSSIQKLRRRSIECDARRPCLPRRTLTHAGSWDERAAASIGENASDPTRLTPHRQPLISARSIIPVLMRAPSAT